jgi:hypothetical protein
MAAISPTSVDTQITRTITWGTMATTDTGAPVSIEEIDASKPITVQVIGTGVPVLQGSNDGVTYAAVTPALTANSLSALTVAPRFLQISSVGTASASVVLHGTRRRISR